MFPDLVSFGPVGIKTYGCCMALGFLAAWKVVAWFCRRSGRNPEAFSNLLIALLVSGVVGARIAYVIEHWQSEFAARPAAVIRIDQGGLMFYGGLILALVSFFVWCRRHRERLLPVADMLAAALPLAHAFGRVGCFFYGCCYGRRSDLWCAVSFPRQSPAWYEQLNAGEIAHSAAGSLPVLPTQLMEAAALVALAALLVRLWLRAADRRPGLVTGCYFAGYAVLRFAMEFLRGDPRAEIGPFSIGQTISLGLFASGVALVAFAALRRRLSAAAGDDRLPQAK